VATHKVCPAERADHIRLRLDNDDVNLVANGSDIITIIAEIVDKKGTVKRLNNSSIRFGIEGEGRLIGDESVEANPCKISWGSAPVLVQSTTKAGRVRITASLVHEGSQTPVGGELIFSSIENSVSEIFNQKELNLIDKQKNQAVKMQIIKSEIELKNEKIRKELNDSKVKEVEKQQNKFGVGIN
jgi:beta-galactosidase